MAEIVRMPKLSDTMTEGVVAKWHKKVGDKVKSGELLAEIETDKATMDFESFFDGVMLHIGIQEGKGAPVDSILAIIGAAGEDVSSLLSGDAPAKVEVAVKTETPAKAAETTVAVPATISSSASSDNRLKASPLAKKLPKIKA